MDNYDAKSRVELDIKIVRTRNNLNQFKMLNRYNFTTKKTYWYLLKELQQLLKTQKRIDFRKFCINIMQIDEFKKAFLKK